MTNEFEITAVISRIKKMEYYFDTILNIIHNKPELLISDPLIKNMLDELIDYYGNGQWLSDYECDERGELPENLKRGVLSQDGVYNLFSDIEDFREIYNKDK